MKMPKARSHEIIVQEVDDECLVYDLSSNKAVCLNTVSAEIWRRCDGITTVREVANLIGSQMNIKLDEDFIWLAMADLSKNNLLAEGTEPPSEFENLSRRKVLFKYALPTLVLPLVISVVAPTALNAQSAPPLACQPPGTFFQVLSVDCGMNAASCPGACISQGNTTCCAMNGTAIVCGSFCTCQCP